MTYDLKGLKLVLAAQKRRLAELVEVCGGEDPEHPLQDLCLRRIRWLETQISKEQEKAAQ